MHCIDENLTDKNEIREKVAKNYNKEKIEGLLPPLRACTHHTFSYHSYNFLSLLRCLIISKVSYHYEGILSL